MQWEKKWKFLIFANKKLSFYLLKSKYLKLYIVYIIILTFEKIIKYNDW